MRDTSALCTPWGGREQVVERAVDAHPDPEEGLVGLDVHVAGAAPHRVVQDEVRELHGLPGLLVSAVSEDDLEVVLELLAPEGIGREVRAEEAAQRGLGDHLHLDVPATAHEDELVHSELVRGVDHADNQGVAVHADRDGLVLAHHGLGHHGQHGLARVDAVDLAHHDAELLAQAGPQVLLAQEAERDQHGSEPAPVRSLVRERHVQLALVEQARIDEHLAEPLPLGLGLGVRHRQRRRSQRIIGQLEQRLGGQLKQLDGRRVGLAHDGRWPGGPGRCGRHSCSRCRFGGRPPPIRPRRRGLEGAGLRDRRGAARDGASQTASTPARAAGRA
jgi:hypothetical protein